MARVNGVITQHLTAFRRNPMQASALKTVATRIEADYQIKLILGGRLLHEASAGAITESLRHIQPPARIELADTIDSVLAWASAVKNRELNYAFDLGELAGLARQGIRIDKDLEQIAEMGILLNVCKEMAILDASITLHDVTLVTSLSVGQKAAVLRNLKILAEQKNTSITDIALAINGLDNEGTYALEEMELNES